MVLLTQKSVTLYIDIYYQYVVLSEAANIVYEICMAVKFLHSRNIAHRDIKVQHILFLFSIKMFFVSVTELNCTLKVHFVTK